MLAKVDVDPGFVLELENEFWIHLGGSFGQGPELLVIMGITVGQHSTGSVRCFAPELTALEHEDLAPAFMQFERDTEANNAGSDDNCVPTFHAKIVANGEVNAKSMRDGSLRQWCPNRRGS